MTKEEIQKAKKFIENRGYGKGSNFTLETVAGLMVAYRVETFKKHSDELDFSNFLQVEGDCDDCTLREHCRPHTSIVDYLGTEYRCVLKLGKIWTI